MATKTQEAAAIALQNPFAQPNDVRSAGYLDIKDIAPHTLRGYVRRVANNLGRDGVYVTLYQNDTIQYGVVSGFNQETKPYGYFELTNIIAGDYTIRLRGGGAIAEEYEITIPGDSSVDETPPTGAHVDSAFEEY